MVVLITCQFLGYAAEKPYRVSKIPVDLLEGAHAVLRDHHTHFTIINEGEGLLKVRYALTILNEQAKDQARLVVRYDKLTKVKDIEGRVYNAAGELIDKLRNSDIEDRSNFQSFSIFEDNRVKTASFSLYTYPYTVEWEYELEVSNMMFYPIWYPQDAEWLAVEKASLRLKAPAGFSLRYKEERVEPVKISSEEGAQIFEWEVANLKSTQREPFSSGWLAQVPVVYTAPSIFSVDGFSGKMDSWKSYGQWINQLNITQQELPASAAAYVKQLTDSLSGPREKVKAVYEYLQNNTRYVSIQLGIGGWQPFKASFVHDKGYGDCKALTNYTQSMLKAIGIPSYYTLIQHGDNRNYLQEDFPISRFNHAILCVPLEQDTVWLECTSQTNPFGFLGKGTFGRGVVVIKEDGGHVVSTRYYSATENEQQTLAEVYLTDTETKGKILRTYKGLQFENANLNYYLHQDAEEQKKWIYHNLGIPGFNLLNYTLKTEVEGEVPQASLQAELELKSQVSRSGKRIFLNPNLANRIENAPPKVDNRKTNFEFSWSYTDVDSIVYHLPEGYTAEFIPPPVKVESEFGIYRSEMEFRQSKLFYRRSFIKTEGVFSAEEYSSYVSFMKQVMEADHQKVVLIKQ